MMEFVLRISYCVLKNLGVVVCNTQFEIRNTARFWIRNTQYAIRFCCD
jgi:hypothetical protein